MVDCAWTPERLVSYPSVTWVDLAADGSMVAYAVREPVLAEEQSRFVNHLYMVPTGGGEALRLTYGDCTNEAPRWSPDCAYLAFLSDRAGERKDLYVMRRAGGEAWRLTQQPKGIQAFGWSSNRRRLAYTAVAADSAEKRAALKARDDALVWGADPENAQLWVIPFTEGGERPPSPTAVTLPTVHIVQCVWADEHRVVVTYQPTSRADDWPETRLAVVDVDAPPAPLQPIARVASGETTLLVRGDLVACATGEEPFTWMGRTRTVVHSLRGEAPQPLARTPDEMPYPIAWSADGAAVHVLERSRTSSAILRLPLDGTEYQVVWQGEGYLKNVSASSRDALACSREGLAQREYVAGMTLGEADWRTLAVPRCDGWPGRLPPTEILRWTNEGLEIEGLLTLPERQAGERVPLVVIVHGGPTGVFSQTCVGAMSHYPIASFAERGYAVLRVNPRGSGGYGYAFRAANRRDWGGGDFRDIMVGVDLVVSRGIADPDRLGIMGWSYGGYMTSWAITQTHRFKAASVGAGVTHLASFTGTSDIPGFLPDYFGAEPWEDSEIYRLHSAVLQARGVSTPTLIQHGADDIRVPLGQGRELYNALKRQGVEVQLVIYPRQGHGPNEPRLEMDIMRRNLEWFDRWLR